MPSHAEKNQTEIKNCYRIIDPEERLSENEKAEEERKVLENMPACFPAALRYVMTRFGFTQEALHITTWRYNFAAKLEIPTRRHLLHPFWGEHRLGTVR
jgi:hypothetical protein